MHRYLGRWWSLTTLLLLMQAGLVYAEQLELSDDFLEYLGSLEGADDNWTDFAATAVTTSKQSSSSKSDTATPANASSASSSAMSKAAVHSSGKVVK
ncbi:MAG: hypothetical protein AB7F79_02380 [Steroidobacteraceae bacterium]